MFSISTDPTAATRQPRAGGRAGEPLYDPPEKTADVWAPIWEETWGPLLRWGWLGGAVCGTRWQTV